MSHHFQKGKFDSKNKKIGLTRRWKIDTESQPREMMTEREKPNERRFMEAEREEDYRFPISSEKDRKKILDHHQFILDHFNKGKNTFQIKPNSQFYSPRNHQLTSGGTY